MRIKEAAPYLVKHYLSDKNRHHTVIFEGKSGVGKSTAVHDARDMLRAQVSDDFALFDMRISTSDPVDFGMVMPENGVMVRQKPAFIEFAEQHPEGGILFLDEITSAPPAVQAPAYQVCLDRGCNGYKLPDTWMVVAAGNLVSDRGVTYQMAAPLRNRMRCFVIDTVLEDALEYMAVHECDPRIMALLSERADLLHKFTKDEYGKQFPTPRGWMRASDTLSLELEDTQRLEAIMGDVGEEAGRVVETFLRVYDQIPSINKIIESPDSVEVPSATNVRYCVVMGLSARMDKKNFDNIYKYLKRMPKEMSTLCVKLAYTRDNTLVHAKTFHEWAMENQDAMRTG